MKHLSEFIKEREYIETLDQSVEDYLSENLNAVPEWKDEVYFNDCIYSDYLYESLLYSYSLKKFLDKFQQLFVIYTYQLDHHDTVLHVRVGSDFDRTNKEFVSLCNLFNVFIAKDQQRTTTIHNITFEQRIPEDVTDEVFQYDYLYHLTTSSVVDKILKYGLQPKSHSKKAYHPERVYMLMPKDNLSLKSMMDQLGANVVLKIDLNKLKTYNQNIRFYTDPMSVGGCSVFTENIIYPEVITKV